MKRVANLVMTALFFLFAFGSMIGNSGHAAEYFSHCGPSGGFGGENFEDHSLGGRRIKEVRIYSGVFIDSIQVVYTNQANDTLSGTKHGGPGGGLGVLKLASDEYIKLVGGKYGSYVDSIYMVTNKEQVKKWGGAGGNVDFSYEVPPGTHIHGFFGRAGKYLDSIGVLMRTIK